MTTRSVAKLLSRRPTILGARQPGAFVLLPYADFERIREAFEDMADLVELERARRESEGEPTIPWETAKKRLAARRRGAGKRR